MLVGVRQFDKETLIAGLLVFRPAPFRPAPLHRSVTTALAILGIQNRGLTSPATHAVHRGRARGVFAEVPGQDHLLSLILSLSAATLVRLSSYSTVTLFEPTLAVGVGPQVSGRAASRRLGSRAWTASADVKSSCFHAPLLPPFAHEHSDWA